MCRILFLLLIVFCESCQKISAEKSLEDTANIEDYKSDIIQVKDNLLYLDGKPLVEISFNKFDLFWSVFGEAEKKGEISFEDYIVKRQQKALSDLHNAGFRTIRFFGAVHPSSYKKWKNVWIDKNKREDIFYKSMDIVLELCNRYNISTVFSLGVAMFIEDGESLLDLVSRSDSKSRIALYSYLDEFIPKYKNNKAIGMWEITNELTLTADLPGKSDSPTMQQVVRFYSDVINYIRKYDSDRIITKGGSAMREHAYGLNNGRGWTKRDTYDEQFQMFELVHKDSGLDIVDIHYYLEQDPRYRITDNDGKDFILNLIEHKTIADKLNMPMYVGEYGALPKTKNDKYADFWERNPDWFETFGNDAPQAMQWVKKAADDAVESGIQLIHWWCYQSDRVQDQKDPMRMDLDIERTPKLFNMIVDANKRLKQKFGVLE